MNEALYTSVPANNTARLVTQQEGCSDTVLLDYSGLCEVLEELKAKRESLAKALGLKTKSQRKNLKNRFQARGCNSWSFEGDRKLLLEYMRIGEELNKFNNEIRGMYEEKALKCKNCKGAMGEIGNSGQFVCGDCGRTIKPKRRKLCTK